jgi:two-component system, sensor histidine kinase and response regulator
VASPERMSALILVVDDVDETRYGIERLLKATGYRVSLARDEEEAIEKAMLLSPDLLLISLGLDTAATLAVIYRIRARAGSSAEVPVVVFCVPALEHGAEVHAGGGNLPHSARQF